MVQIDFFDKNVINNLVPVLSMQPHVLCVVYDEKRVVKEDYRNFISAVRSMDSFIEIREYTCDSHDIDNISEVITNIAEEYCEEEIYVDVTGGPELCIAAALMVAKEIPINPIYLDEEQELLFCVYDRDVKFKAKRITMENYVIAKGAKHFSDSRSYPREEEYENICKMAERIFDYLEEWKLLQKYLSTYFYGYSGMHFSAANIKCAKDRTRGINDLLDYFAKYGFIEQRDNGKFVVKNDRYKEYITNYGIWLEMYIYIKAKECFDEVHLGFIIDWDSDDGTDTSDNEFDVVIMNKNRPVLVSCKMTKPTTKDLTEIGCLAGRLGGEDAVSVLATTYPVRAYNEGGTSLYNRMKKLDIGFIEAYDFRRMSTKEAFDRAIAFSK